MKKYIHILIVFWLGILTGLAQTRTENYIKTIQPKSATTTTAQPSPPSGILIQKDELETIVYYDGLGRPKQEIAVGMAPNGKSIVKHIEYELNIGQVKEYLPYVPGYNPDEGNTGLISNIPNRSFQSNAKSNTETFYNTNKYERTTNPYSETELEKSPLKRVLKQGSPGEDWRINRGIGSSKNVVYSYQFNTANQVKNYKAVATWNARLKQYDIRIVDHGYYAANQLYLTTTTDEDGSSTIQFTDQEGKVLIIGKRLDLEVVIGGPKVPVSANTNAVNPMSELEGRSVSDILANADEIATSMADQAGENFNIINPKDPKDIDSLLGNSLFTYYVYDQYNNLTYVLPPLANGAIDAVTLDKLCYQYKYDHKNRLVAKKLPGREWEFMVYDKADRLLAQGPIYSPFGDESKGWMFSKYDAFDRVTYTGFYTGTPATEAGRNTFQGLVDATADFHEYSTTVDTTLDQIRIPYSNVTMPKTAVKILSVNYYDGYSFAGAPTSFTAIEGQTVMANVKGLPTGSWTRVITTANEVQGTLNYMLYDEKERVVRSHKTNNLGGYTQVDTKYNFRGLPTKTVTSHKYNTGAVAKTITETYSYDKAERLLYQTHQLDNADVVVVFQNIYDELGRVKQKRVGGKMNNGVSGTTSTAPQNNWEIEGPIITSSSPNRQSFLQEINYTYNIRGWLTKINETTNLEAGDFGKKALFAVKLNYNNLDNPSLAGIKKLYNGTIAEQTWKTANDNVLRRYSYGYDKMNRLKTGIYQEPGGSTPITGVYNENMTYDYNGNIKSLNRKGKGVNSGIALDLDILSYTYDGNILQKVVDSSNNTDGFKQGSTAAKHYDYDTFGNLKVDRNKGITAIQYNHLNLPTEVAFAGGKINYLYTATGEKIQKKVTQGSTAVVTDYVDGFQYVGGVLSFFPTAEGYYNAETQNYVYQYRDHLGNVRLTYSDANKNDKIDVGEIIEETNYYPFGLAHSGYNEKNNTIGKNYKYRYNTKEYQDELGLNLYDYGARNYDAALGRWMNVDPLAEKMPNWNPYAYTFNNPINFTDPTGMIGEDWVEHATDKGEKLFTYDAFVHSEEDAKERGYRNVKGVSETMSYNGTSGTESYNLNADGSVTDNLNGTTTDVGFSPMRTSDGFYISENNHLKAITSSLQKGGDAMTYAGLGFSITGVGAPIGGIMMTVGGVMSFGGTLIESGYLMSQGKEKEAWVKLGLSGLFIGTGYVGVGLSKKVVGQSFNTSVETVIQGTNITLEKTIGADTEKIINKK